MAHVLVAALFGLYALLVARYGHYWRRPGFQWIEYVAGALIVVLGTWWHLQLSPSADWFTTIVGHYGIAGVIVIPLEIGLVAREKQQAEIIRRADEAALVREELSQ